MVTELNSYDLVVIGAGPAGSAAAMTARQAGLSVALIDKARFPRDKLCGALVSGRSLKALDAIFGRRPPSDMFLISRETAFLWGGEELARFQAPHDLWFTMRREFDHWLLQAALSAGVVDYTGQRWVKLDQAAGRLDFAAGGALSFRALIAADGVTSPVAAKLFGRAFEPEKIGFALEAECARDPGAPPLIEIDFRLVRWGYGWRFPKRDGLTIGVGGVKRENPDMRPPQEALMRGHSAGDETIKGAFLPFGSFHKAPGQGCVLLAGDAAGLVDPLTGEGIAYALESGALAAGVVAEALAKGQPEGAAKAYRRALKGIHAELGRASKLRQIVYSAQFNRVFRDKLQNSTRIRQVFFDLLEGNTSYRDIEKIIAKGAFRKLGQGLSSWPGRGD